MTSSLIFMHSANTVNSNGSNESQLVRGGLSFDVFDTIDSYFSSQVGPWAATCPKFDDSTASILSKKINGTRNSRTSNHSFLTQPILLYQSINLFT